MTSKSKKAVAISVSAVLIAIFLVLNIACGIFADYVTAFLCGYGADSEEMTAARQESAALADQIVGEGIVMVQNENDTLPLSKTEDARVNVFGWSSTQWVYGGSGSGQVQQPGDEAEPVGILEALESADIEYNTELTDMYRSYLAERPYASTGALNSWNYQFSRLYEPSIDDTRYYSQSLLSNAEAYSDTAIVVIGRVSGESNDQPKVQYKGAFDRTAHDNGTDDKDTTRTYLEISTEEEALLEYVGAHYDKVVVLINALNTFELGFMETIEGLDACLIVGGTGWTGATAIPKVLYGDLSPSGHVVDTYAYALESYASYANSGGYEGENYYTNATDDLYPMTVTNGNVGDNTTPYEGVAYVDYVEGIYIGYKWFETADEEGYWDGVSNEYGEGYEGVVQYPYGYGLSYTEFSWEVIDISAGSGATLGADDEITITVRVTNEGDVAGQDVVQLYYTPPYIEGEIEKASVNLADFARTQILEPDEYEDLTLSFSVYDMASYDCYDRNENGFAGHELDAGTYLVSLRSDAHTTHDLLNTPNSVVTDPVIEYEIEAAEYPTDPVTGNEVSNKFTGEDAIDGISIDGSDSGADIQWLTRGDFEGTFPSELAPAREMTQNLIDTNLYTEEDANAWVDPTDEPVTFDADNGLSITTTDEEGNTVVSELGLELGADYDDPRWDDLLDQLNKEEGLTLVLNGYAANGAVPSIGKPATVDLDGPAQIGSFGMAMMYGTGTGFPCATVLGQTFNKNLAYDFGLSLGREGVTMGINGWYGPAINLHRSAFGGRNFEYYSEDSYQMGIMCAEAVRGAKNAGMYSYLKHLVLYEQEWNRDGIYTWLTEQTLREIYLRPFQIAIQEGGATGIMSSYNRIGAIWAGGSEALLSNEGVLRGEWGFRGAVLTDYCDHHVYMNGDHQFRAGGDLWMSGVYFPGWGEPAELDYETESNTFNQRLREAVKNNTYMYLNAQYANSIYNAAEDTVPITGGTKTDVFPWWIPVLVVLDVVVVAGCAVWIFFAFRKGGKKNEKAA